MSDEKLLTADVVKTLLGAFLLLGTLGYLGEYLDNRTTTRVECTNGETFENSTVIKGTRIKHSDGSITDIPQRVLCKEVHTKS